MTKLLPTTAPDTAIEVLGCWILNGHKKPLRYRTVRVLKDAEALESYRRKLEDKYGLPVAMMYRSKDGYTQRCGTSQLFICDECDA